MSSSTFDGTVVRVIKSVRGGYREYFLWFLTPGIDTSLALNFVNAEIVVAEYHLVDLPKLAPRTEIVRRHVKGLRDATISCKPLPKLEWEYVDISHVDPMDEDEFWTVVSLLEGDFDGERKREVVAELRRRGPDAAASFQRRLSLCLQEIDHPANAMRTNGIVSDDASLDFRLSIIASGRDAFNAVLANPGTHQVPGNAEWLLTVASRAQSASPKRQVIFLTGLDVSTGANIETWGPKPDIPEHPVFSPYENWKNSLHVRALADGMDPDTEPWFQIENQMNWYGVYGVDEGGEFLEIHQLPADSPGPSSSVVEGERRQIEAAVRRDHPQATEVVVESSGMPSDFRVIASFVRRTRLDRRAYLDMLGRSEG